MARWELVQENAKRIKIVSNPILGVVSEGVVYVDIYRRLRRNGTYKFKNIER